MSRPCLLNPYLDQQWPTDATSRVCFIREWLSEVLCSGRCGASLSSMRKHLVTDQTYVHGNKSDSSASASQNGQHFTFVDKNDLAIPPLDCCHLRSARLVSLIPPSLYSNHFASEASPWLSKLLPPQNISYPISALFFFLLSSYYHLIFFIHVVCLSPPLECNFHEGI